MKYKSLILLSALAVAFASCDEIEMSDSKPVTNPQEPIFQANGVTVTTAGELASGNVINLQTLLDNEQESLEAFTIAVDNADLPELSDIYGYFEVSASEDFSAPETYKNLEIENYTAYVPLQDLLEAHQKFFGKAPVERTMYYRIPLYADVEGATYRLAGPDYYYAQGSFKTLGLDPGFEIEDTYYILGTSGWDPFNDCVAFTNYGISPYDDPEFHITVTVASNTYFKIVPQSSYDMLANQTEVPAEFWDSLIGAETDGDASLSGVLVGLHVDETTGEEVQAGSLLLEAAGIYNIKINMETWTYTIEQGTAVPDAPGVPSGIYLRGGFGDGSWAAMPEYEFLTTEDIGVYVIPYITIDPVEFKVADADWGSVNLGGNGDNVVIGQEYPLNGGANIKLEEAFTGAVILTNDNGAYSLLLLEYKATTEGVASGIYLRGGMNDWGADSAYEFVSGPVENVWYLTNQTLSAGVEFKVADEGWSTVNYGTNEGVFDESEGQGVLGLVYNAGNISLSKDFTGTLLLVKVGNYYFLYFRSAEN